MRVIAGVAKGRRLQGPAGWGTRPMTDRAKEGIFSAIAADLPRAAVLDLYAGSGSLGLEALSRGALSVVFVENDRQAINALRDNVAAVGLGGGIVTQDVRQFLADSSREAIYDLAFVDPPYDLSLPSVTTVLGALVKRLDPDSLVVLHRRVGEVRPEIAGLVTDGARTYGTAQIWRYRRSGGDEPPARKRENGARKR